jgi:membrane-associated phospholipid phosphatase
VNPESRRRTNAPLAGSAGMAKKLKPPKAAKRASAPERIDAALGHAAMAHRKHPLVRALGAAGEIADQPPLIAIGVVTSVAGAAARNPRLLRAGLRMLASELVATGAKALIKHHIARTRPGTMRKQGRYALHVDGKGKKDDGPWNSFPSGHTAGAVAVTRALAREYPAAAPALAAGATGVALAQLPTGAHFPSDVAAGAALGLASEALVDQVARRL